MKRFVIGGLIAAQTVVAAQPSVAAGLDAPPAVQTGAFAGVRLRLSLGGKQQEPRVRAGLTLAPTLRSHSISSGYRTRIGEGLELGLARERPTIALAGMPANRLLSGGVSSQDNKLGISTGATIAIGVGVALVVGAAVFYSAATDCEDHDDECG